MTDFTPISLNDGDCDECGVTHERWSVHRRGHQHQNCEDCGHSHSPWSLHERDSRRRAGSTGQSILLQAQVEAELTPVLHRLLDRWVRSDDLTVDDVRYSVAAAFDVVVEELQLDDA